MEFALACRSASTSLARFSSASFSRSALDKNFGCDHRERLELVADTQLRDVNRRCDKHTLAAAASASFFFLMSSSTLSGAALGFFVPHPDFFFKGSAGGAGGASGGGGGGRAASGGGGGAPKSSGGGGGGDGGRSKESGGGAGGGTEIPFVSIPSMAPMVQRGNVVDDAGQAANRPPSASASRISTAAKMHRTRNHVAIGSMGLYVSLITAMPSICWPVVCM